MRVRVKEGCSVGVDGTFHPSGAEVVLSAHEVVKHLASLEPADDKAEAFFAAAADEGGAA
jgi:hypothetical protein